MTDLDLEIKLKELGIWYNFLDKEETIHTSDASLATGIDIHRITKNLISKTNKGNYVLLIIPGDMRVDLKKAAKALKVKNVRLLQPLNAHKISGFPTGGTPSIGLKEKVVTIFDEELSIYETIYCGGGTRSRLLELRRDDVLRISGAIIAKISKF
jgi:Cys-tRNA(Pro)/Cys-tRNA(Cys) deacylase